MVLPLPLLLIPFFLLSGATSEPFYNNRITVKCTGTTYAANTPYQTNLNTLLSSLASQSSSTSYNNATVGTGTDRIYGLYLCEGDLAHTDCQTCVQSATSSITAPESCPGSRQAIIWYDYCMVRYSDTNFFGVVDSDGFSMTIPGPNQKTNSPVPYEVVANLVQVAPSLRPMFASNASEILNLCAMAVCTDDLTSAGCGQCLKAILGNIKLCCTQFKGWRYLSASCWIRYEVSPFLRNLDFTQIVESTCSAVNLPPSNNPDALISDIISKAAPTGFYSDSNNQLYGLALCRGDISVPSNDCSNCLTKARSTLMYDCPNNTQGIVWYEECMVRYSNVNFFGNVDYNGKTYCGVEPVSSDFGDATIAFATELVRVAANKMLMYAANEMGVGGSQPRYVLAQCSRDLSSENCESCLQKGISDVTEKCKQTNGWRYLSGSCNIRYEIVPFFNTSTIEMGNQHNNQNHL